MPTVLRTKGFGSSFSASNGRNLPHVHVEKAENYAKFWLDPILLAKNRGFRSRELTELRTIVQVNRQLFLEKWSEHFDR